MAIKVASHLTPGTADSTPAEDNPMKISTILLIASALGAASPTFAEGGAERTLSRMSQARQVDTPVPVVTAERNADSSGRDSQAPAVPHSRC